jgi:hypothetical protein
MGTWRAMPQSSSTNASGDSGTVQASERLLCDAAPGPPPPLQPLEFSVTQDDPFFTPNRGGLLRLAVVAVGAYGDRRRQAG